MTSESDYLEYLSIESVPSGLPTSEPTGVYEMLSSSLYMTNATEYLTVSQFAAVLSLHPVTCGGGDFINSLSPVTPRPSMFAVQYACAGVPPEVKTSTTLLTPNLVLDPTLILFRYRSPPPWFTRHL